jgi:hypothetical protein
VRNEAHHKEEHLQHHWQQDRNSSYSDFLATHPLVFSGARDPLDEDDWLRTTESKFGLLHCTKYQKNSVCRPVVEGSSRGLVGIISRSTTSRPPHGMG